MARTSQVPPKGSRRYWFQFNFLDHAGKQVTLGRMYSTDLNRPPDPDPSFSFQVYSLIQLDSDHTKLLEYLTSGLDWDLIPTFEIYAEQQPDIFSYVEHQRREIAHRKASRDTPTDESLPLIAKLAAARLKRCLRREFPPFNTFMEELYRVFTVVLNKPDFINETGVLFVLTDGGKQKPQMGIDIDDYEAQVWRSGGMAEVARRLGMLMLDEMEQQTA
ncbi:hypothetical protein VTN00DRAFT_6877 [Thermoascus crustaceus]|uniref:uncharacterized protein n=1 Tax=Thermoascus crustaceus TaxID=5088 RepID=UPI003742F5F4